MKYRLFVDASQDANMKTGAAGACFYCTAEGKEVFQKSYSFKCGDGNEAEFRALRAACKTLHRVMKPGDKAVVYLDSDNARDRALTSKKWWLKDTSLKVVKSHKAGNEVALANQHVDLQAKKEMRKLRDEIIHLRNLGQMKHSMSIT